MIGWLKRSWFESRSLGVLQVYYEQPSKKPLPDFKARLLRGAVNKTMADGGTPFDAATRFYAAYAETTVEKGGSLDSIGWAGALGRFSALRGKMRFYDEHMAAFKGVSAASKRRT